MANLSQLPYIDDDLNHNLFIPYSSQFQSNNTAYTLLINGDVSSSNITMNNMTEDESKIKTFYDRCGSGMPLYLSRFIVDVVITFPVSLLGIVGNLLAFIVLYKQQSNVSTNLLLRALAITDSLVLIIGIPLRSVRMCHSCLKLVDNTDYYNVYSYIFLCLYPMLYIVRMCCTWLTTLLTIDRWIAVCRPLHAQTLLTHKVAWIQIIITVVCSVCFSIPRMFELEVSHKDDLRVLTQTNLSRNYQYNILYKISAFFLVTYIVPIILLVRFNKLLWSALLKSDKERAYLHQNSQSNNVSPSYSRSLTFIVVVVTFSFLICNIPALVSQLLYSIKTVLPELAKDLDMRRRYSTIASNLMITLNSACNFIIYCLFSRNFRNTLVKLFSRYRNIKSRAKRASSSTSALTYASMLHKRPSDTSSVHGRIKFKEYECVHNTMNNIGQDNSICLNDM